MKISFSNARSKRHYFVIISVYLIFFDNVSIRRSDDLVEIDRTLINNRRFSEIYEIVRWTSLQRHHLYKDARESWIVLRQYDDANITSCEIWQNFKSTLSLSFTNDY